MRKKLTRPKHSSQTNRERTAFAYPQLFASQTRIYENCPSGNAALDRLVLLCIALSGYERNTCSRRSGGWRTRAHAVLRREPKTLRSLGKPATFEFLGDDQVEGLQSYDIGITFVNSRMKVVESFAYDHDGKLAGINFQVLGPTKQ